jgi:hypothetical protein
VGQDWGGLREVVAGGRSVATRGWIDARIGQALGNDRYQGMAFGWIFLVLLGVMNPLWIWIGALVLYGVFEFWSRLRSEQRLGAKRALATLEHTALGIARALAR